MNITSIELPLCEIKNVSYLQKCFPVFDGIIYSVAIPIVTAEKIVLNLALQPSKEKTDSSLLLPYMLSFAGKFYLRRL